MCQSVSLTEENRENPKKSPCFVAEHIVTLAILAREHELLQANQGQLTLLMCFCNPLEEGESSQ